MPEKEKLKCENWRCGWTGTEVLDDLYVGVHRKAQRRHTADEALAAA